MEIEFLPRSKIGMTNMHLGTDLQHGVDLFWGTNFRIRLHAVFAIFSSSPDYLLRMKTRAHAPHRRWNRSLLPLLPFLAAAFTGCIHEPQMIPVNRQKLIDRSIVEYPGGCTFTKIVNGLNCPTAICWDSAGNMFIAESGIDGSEPHIFGYHKDHSYFQIYPWKRDLSFYPTGPNVLFGPIGGMAAYPGGLIVSHRDRNGYGRVTVLGYDGSQRTLVGLLPARGDYGVTDVCVHNGRVYFGVGTATNSGVVGIDNFDKGWLKRYPGVHDELYQPDKKPIKLQGYRFDTPNPWAGIFTGPLSVVGPFQAFGHSNLSRIPPSDKPNGAIYSVSVDGGEVKIEAYGLHNPRGIAFGAYDYGYFTNDGMEMRGTRPIFDDPDVVGHFTSDAGWFGWPDYTSDGHPVSDPAYLPPISMLIPSGYRELSLLIDQQTSGLFLAKFDALIYGNFPSLSGAAKMDVVPGTGPFKDLKDDFIVALDGDRSPYATSGMMKLQFHPGFKVALVDFESKRTTDFVHNTAGVPASMQPFGTVALERPCDVKVGPDGDIYIVDFGRMDNNSAIPRYYPGTGCLFKLHMIQSEKPAGSQP
jgi:hypothetical protein